MTDEVKALYRPDRHMPPAGNAMPIGREGLAERREIEAYLASQMVVPIETHQLTGERGGRPSVRQVNEAMDAMTIAERVHLEIEMTERRGTLYTSDYDPMRY